MPGIRISTRRGILVALLLVVITFGVMGQSPYLSTSVHIDQLLSRTKEYDGKIVSIAGEAIGDRMTRGDHVWVNILEDGTAIGVWLTTEQASQIHELGKYEREGDIMQVSGTFHRACSDHSGETDIHATEVRILKKGTTYRVDMKEDRLITGLGLCCTGGLLTLLWRRRERKNPAS